MTDTYNTDETTADLINWLNQMPVGKTEYFETTYYPKCPFSVERISDEEWRVKIPNLVIQFLHNEGKAISFKTEDCLLDTTSKNLEKLAASIGYYIKNYGYEDAPGYPVAGHDYPPDFPIR